MAQVSATPVSDLPMIVCHNMTDQGMLVAKPRCRTQNARDMERRLQQDQLEDSSLALCRLAFTGDFRKPGPGRLLSSANFAADDYSDAEIMQKGGQFTLAALCLGGKSWLLRADRWLLSTDCAINGLVAR
jgi:hypothetical protein